MFARLFLHKRGRGRPQGRDRSANVRRERSQEPGEASSSTYGRPRPRPPLTGDYVMAGAIVPRLPDKERGTVQTAAWQRL